MVSLAVAPLREALRQRWWRQQLAGSVAAVVAVGIASAARRLRSWPRLAMAAPAAEARRQRGGGGQLGSGGGSLARVRRWRWWQSGGGVGSGSAAVAAVATASLAAEEAAWRKRDFGGSG